MGAREHGGPCLLCRVGAHVCALPLPTVIETMRPLRTSALAGSPDFVCGVAVIRGAPVPVVDAARLLGVAGAGPAGRYVTLRAGARTVALAVGSVEGVASLDDVDLDGLPPLLAAANDVTVTAIGRLDADLLLVLEGARMVPEGVWSAIE